MDLATLGDRAFERGRLSLSARLRRLQSKAWHVGQSAIAAAVAWVVAAQLLGHQQPFFAPVVAVVCLGQSYGQRLRRVAEVMVGVSVGIGVADLFVSAFGRGSWQIGVVAALAMVAAILLDAGALLTTQATVQSIIVVTLLPLPGSGQRVLDALVGGCVALVAATVVPAAPLRRPREEAAKVAAELARLLRSARQASLDVDVEEAERILDRARETEALLTELRAAASEGLEIVRTSPFRRRTRHQVRSIADVVTPLDRAFRTSRVMIRRLAISARLGETMPPDYHELIDRLADATEHIADEFAANRPPTAAEDQLIAIGEATADAGEPLTLSAAVVLAQIRSLTVDLLQLAGMLDHQAFATLPPRP